MKLRLLLTTLFFITIGFSQNKGTITGTLFDKDAGNESLPFANVGIRGTTTGTNTDIDGKYTLTIAPGNYTIVYSFLGYEPIEVPVTVVANETQTINQTLTAGGYTLQDVVVTNTGGREKESALLLEQKNAVVIKQSIGAQEMARKGVSDVEEGLTKITGITKVGSRGLFVRGLEDRYNNLLINDLATPSNNPYQKYISLDLFPSDIVSVIEVYKTFNTNIYGDFAGGTFNVETSRVTKSITKFNVSIGYTTNNSFQDFLIAENADSAQGFFGLTGKDRQIPSILGTTPASYTMTGQQSLDAFQKSGFNVSDTKSPLNTSIGFLNAEKFDLKNNANFSYMLSLSFDNDFSITQGVQRNFNNNPSGYVYNSNFVTTDYTYDTSFTGLVGLNYSINKLKLSYNTTYIKTSESLIQDQFGVANTNQSNNDALIRTNQLDDSTYLNNQLLGEYELSDNQYIKAGISYALTKYDQPDRNFFSGTKSGANDITTVAGANNFIRQYLDITSDFYISSLAEYNYKFGSGEKKNKLTGGYNGFTTNMESSYRFISSTNVSAPNPFTTSLNNIDEQLNSYLASNAINFRESSNATWQAKLAQSVYSGYANLLYNFGEKWELNGGLRVENSIRDTQYRQQGSFKAPFIDVSINDLYFLPAINVKYGISDKTNLRFAASETYTTPIIMEAYPIEYINGDGTSTRGNPYLVNSDNYNVDLKYETFPSSGEMISAGLFGKKILEPIERTFIANASNTTITTYLNSDSAILYGAELEFILDLERINPVLSDFSWGFNTSLMYTQVDVKPTFIDPNGVETTSIETHQQRALQGASKYLINSDLKYQFNLSKVCTNTLSLVYSVFGERIYAVGTGGLDNIYELPVNQLDFVWNSKLSDHIDLKFSAKNILNPNIQFQQGNNGNAPLLDDATIRSYKTGVNFSLNFGYTF